MAPGLKKPRVKSPTVTADGNACDGVNDACDGVWACGGLSGKTVWAAVAVMFALHATIFGLTMYPSTPGTSCTPHTQSTYTLYQQACVARVAPGSCRGWFVVVVCLN